MSNQKKGVSIVIPTLNEEKNIDQLLANIMALNRSSSNSYYDLEIIVADANSEDRTRKVAQMYGARIIDGGLPGYARNQGAKNARNDIIYFIDADVRIEDPNFIHKSFEEFNKRGLACAGMNNYLLWENKENFLTKLAADIAFCITNFYIKGVQHTKSPKAVSTAMIVKRDDFNKIGGFNESIYWGEDSELAQRFSRYGYKFGILNSVYVKVSPRKIVSQGSIKFVKNVLKLNAYRKKYGEVSRIIYNQLTGIKDYFAR